MHHLYVTALAQISLAPVVAIVGLAAGVDWRWLITVLLGLGLVAVVEPIRAVMELGRRRQAADEWLLWGAVAHPSSSLLSWRAAELTSPGKRSTLARSLRRVEQDVSRDTSLHLFLSTGLRFAATSAVSGRCRSASTITAVPSTRAGFCSSSGSLPSLEARSMRQGSDDALADALGEALAALDPAPLAEAGVTPTVRKASTSPSPLGRFRHPCEAVGVSSSVVGREVEIAAIEASLAAEGSRPAGLLIEGEPGIGKTTVWREYVRLAQARGLCVLATLSTESEVKLSFAGLSDLLSSVPADVVASLPPPQRAALDVALLRIDAPRPPERRLLGTAFGSLLRELATRRRGRRRDRRRPVARRSVGRGDGVRAAPSG